MRLINKGGGKIHKSLLNLDCHRTTSNYSFFFFYAFFVLFSCRYLTCLSSFSFYLVVIVVNKGNNKITEWYDSGKKKSHGNIEPLWTTRFRERIEQVSFRSLPSRIILYRHTLFRDDRECDGGEFLRNFRNWLWYLQ
jgi:hypothetical protein